MRQCHSDFHQKHQVRLMTWFTKQEILNARFIITMNICPYEYIAAKMSVNISHENQYVWC